MTRSNILIICATLVICVLIYSFPSIYRQFKPAPAKHYRWPLTQF